MRAVCQRVSQARVRVAGEIVAEIGTGLCVLLGVGRGDAGGEAARLAGKVARLRVFPDAAGRFDRSLLDAAGAALVVSQFTLYADARKGRRPSFIQAAPPEQAEALVERLVATLRELGVTTATGRFRSHMLVEIQNDGPVTIWLDTGELRPPQP
jgi:D-aminoacyl-tRNA deacylase